MNESLELSTAKAVAALQQQLTRLEVKIDAIGLLLAGQRYATKWDSADFHQGMGMK